MLLRLFCLNVFLILSLSCLQSQERYFNFETISPIDLQLSMVVVDIIEDEDGYIWLSGFDGTVRYDGHRFLRLDQVYPGLDDLPCHNHRSVYKDLDGDLWIGGNGCGVFRIDSKGNYTSFQDLLIDSIDVPLIISHIYHDEDVLWVVSSRKLHTYKKDKSGKYKEIHLPELPYSARIWDIIWNQNEAWISADSSIYRYQIRSEKSLEFPIGKIGRLSFDRTGVPWIMTYDNGVQFAYFNKDKFIPFEHQFFKNVNGGVAFCFGDNNTIWARRGLGGLYAANLKENKDLIVDSKQHNIKSDQYIRKLFCDSSGALWLSSRYVHRLPFQSGIEGRVVNNKEEFIKDMVIETDTSVIAIGNVGLEVHMPNKEKQFFNKQNSKLASNYSINIFNTMDGNYSMCMQNWFQVFSLPNHFSKAVRLNGNSRTLFEDEDYFWVGAVNSVYQIDKKLNIVNIHPLKSSQATIYINGIEEFDDNQLILATNKKGILMLNKSTGEIKEIELPILSNNNLVTVNDIDYNSTSDQLAMACDNGVFIYSFSNKSYSRVSSSKANFSNIVFQSDTILFSTANGKVIRYNTLTKEEKIYGKVHGLLNENHSLRSNFIDRDKRVYFGGNNGIDVFGTSKPSTNKIAPKVIIPYYIRDRKDTIYISDSIINIGPGVNNIDLEINAIHAAQSSGITTRFKIEQDKAWKVITPGEKISFIKPSPGSHRLLFESRNADGFGGDTGYSITMNVDEVWYKKRWLLSIMTLVFSAFVFVFFLRNQRKKAENKNKQVHLENEILNLKLTALNAQMNPHFVFNAMSSIQQIISEGDQETAINYLNKFSRLLRHIVNYANESTVLLSEELVFIENYLQLEQMRFEDTFSYTIDHSVKDINKTRIPTFIIQPQIENAIKHGIMNSPRRGVITIKISKNVETLNIDIEDNGVGRKSSGNSLKLNSKIASKGIELTAQKVKQMNENGYLASYDIIDLKSDDGHGIGTRVSFTFFNIDEIV